MSEDLVKLVRESALGILSRERENGDPWAGVLEGGWIGIGVPEELGGQGGTLAEAAAVARAAGATACWAPVVESMLVGLMVSACPAVRGLLADLSEGKERATLVPNVVHSDTSGCVADEMIAPWGRYATLVVLIVALDEGGLGLVAIPRDDLQFEERRTLAGDPLDMLQVEGNQLPAAVHQLDMPLDQLIGAGGLLSAARLVGAMRVVADMSVEYAQERKQFGRPIGAFQAIAHDLVRQTGNVALAEAALDLAVRAAVSGDMAHAAAARTVASTVSPEVVRVAHQVHGAIGTTREHPLHHHTLRLASWRDAFGSTRWWTRRVGRHALASETWWDELDPAECLV